MREIQIFKHEVFGAIRTMTDEKGEVFFVGKDVAKALGYSQPDKAIMRHTEEDDRMKCTVIDKLRRGQKMYIINESGLYALVLSSKLPRAKAFKRWVTSVVLPQIRRTGGYIPIRDADGRVLTETEILKRANEIVGESLRLVNGSNTDCLTATEVARSWGMDVKSFNQLLSRMGIQYRQYGRWRLTKELGHLGLAKDRLFVYYSLKGVHKLRSYLVWTPEGVRYLNQRFLASDTGKMKVVQLNFLFGTI